MKIALLGFGVVGRGVYDITSNLDDIKVAKVLCLEDVTLPDAEVTRDYQSIVTDPSIDTVVEAMGGLHPAFEFVKGALEAGKNVVTSNKALVANFYDELLPLAKSKGVCLRCTAAVGGGIRWLSELENSRKLQSIEGVYGIMNGTCNYILHNMTRNGLDYGEALSQAQKLGYAEANPSTDVDGIDTYHKLILSANIAFGVSLDKEQVAVSGIRNIRGQDVAQFTAHGLVCKLIATGRKTESGIAAFVQPTLVPADAMEANVGTNFNLISLDGAYTGVQSFYGQGAGRYPTAYSVVRDCVDVKNGLGFYCDTYEKTGVNNADVQMCYYVSGASDSYLAENTAEIWGDAIVTKPVSVEKMHAWAKEHPDALIAAIR